MGDAVLSNDHATDTSTASSDRNSNSHDEDSTQHVARIPVDKSETARRRLARHSSLLCTAINVLILGHPRRSISYN